MRAAPQSTGSAVSSCSRARPDGHSIGPTTTPNVPTIPTERRNSFPWREYDGLGNLVDAPGGFAIPKGVRASRANTAQPAPPPASI